MSAAAIDFSDLGGKRVEAGASPNTIDFSDLGGKVVQQSSVASRPGVPRPSVEMNFANPAPTENVPVLGAMAQPVGELAANLVYDPQFRKQTAEYGATAAGATAVGAGAGIPGAASKLLPPTIAGVQAVGEWAKRNPVAAYLIYDQLHRHFGGALKFVKGMPNVPPE